MKGGDTYEKDQDKKSTAGMKPNPEALNKITIYIITELGGKRKMFLSSKILPRLMKAAFKGPGLRIGMVEGGLYLAQPNNWEVLLLKNSLGNKIKSTVIELHGQFPRPGEVLQIRKGEAAYPVPLPERASGAGKAGGGVHQGHPLSQRG